MYLTNLGLQPLHFAFIKFMPLEQEEEEEEEEVPDCSWICTKGESQFQGYTYTTKGVSSNSTRKGCSW